jgi:hypothetical protein
MVFVGRDGCTLLVIFHAAVINPKPLAWFVFIDREKMLVARSTVIHTGVAIDIAFVSIYPNNPLTITYGVVAAIAVSEMNTLAVVVGIRVMQYTIVNYLKKH